MGRAKVSPHSTIVIAPDIYSGSGRILENLVYMVEKRYASTLYVPTLRKPGRGLSLGKPIASNTPRTLKKILVNFDLPHPPSSIGDCIRLERVLALMIAEKVGADTILVNFNRSLANMVAIESLLKGEPWILGDLEDHWIHKETLIVAPLANVEAESIVAYGFLRGYMEDPTYRCKSLVDKIYYSIAWKRPELEFSSTRSLSFLGQTAYFKGLNRCRVCKGYSPDEICPNCKRMGLERIKMQVEIM
ncbi:MAG: hypothetical protein F7C07_02485 [Desulfurococcales archaeon]|nr:hypothetical protein [Desulfurococcales archaeon]